MERRVQIELAQRLLHYLEHPSACLAGDVSYNDKTIYTAPAQHAAEQGALFRRHPLVAGFTCQLREPGDFVTGDLAGVPLLLVRGRDGEARAFRNVCRHRGAAVVEADCGRHGQSFACPYHGWVYNLEGRLVSMPDKGFGFGGVETDALGLLPLPAAERHGLVWVLPEGVGAPDIDAYLGPLGQELAGFGFADYHHFQTVTRRPAVNWKLVSDGFWEAYHLKVLHKRTIEPILDGRVMAFDAFGRHHRMAVPRRTLEELRTVPQGDWDVLPRVIVLYGLFPNTVFALQGDHVEVTRIFPGRQPGECTVHFSLFTPEAVTTDSARDHWQRNLELLLATVEQEDFRVAQRIQAGAEAGEPRWQLIGRYEPALAHFHRILRLALGQPADLWPPAGDALAAGPGGRANAKPRRVG
jgi:phenylpropionate dioxygenase-like ring-hydroxylating dioxygenase large terminal subunit